VAKVLATVSGTALKPGVSRNRRLYTREAIAAAVSRAQGQLADGGIALTMRSHHAADDDSTRIVGAVRSVTLAEDGSARFTADIADTEHGRTIAALLDTSDGKPPFLSGVSIRGAWDGAVRKERGPDGSAVERGESLTLLGLDYTASPGVPGAAVDAFAWAKDGATETDARVLITESVEEARVTMTEDAPAAPGEIREALRAILGEAISGGSTPPVHKRDSGLSDDTGRRYADPGYQADHRQRYDISTKAKAKAAWSYVNQADNAKAYSGAQLKRVKGRIRAALRGFGVTVAAEGWCVEAPLLITEAIAEYAGLDRDCCGSYSLSATNGPTTVTVCSYGLDPADLHVVLAQACSAASAALCSIDPDMDGDIDVPGAEAEDDDGDAAQMGSGDGVEDLVARLRAVIKGESAEDPQALLAEALSATAVTEAAPDPAPEPAAANQGMEAPVSETTTTEAAGHVAAATFTKADLDDAVARGIAQAEEARRARKAAKRGAATPAETAPAAGAPVTETDDQRIARIVAEKVAALTVTETEEQRIDRLVREQLTTAKQQLMESGGGPSRKGLVTEHSGARATGADGLPEDFPMKDGVMIPQERWTEAQRQAVGRSLQDYVLGDKAVY
jgi:hypothetical protein